MASTRRTSLSKQSTSRAGLLEQVWYWGEADKSTVSRALFDQPDGAFIVRKSSTPGDFTLTVKYNGQMKLIKIMGKYDKWGFSEETMVHDSVVNLIDFHRNISLAVYNDQLDTKLLYPVGMRRNSHSSRASMKKASAVDRTHIFHAKNPEDWEERLGLERLRIAQTCCDRAARLFDIAHAEGERAENLHHALAKSITDYEKKLEKLEDVLEVQKKLHGATTEPSIDPSADKMTKAIAGNRKILEESIRRIRGELDETIAEKAKLAMIMDEMSGDLARANDRLMACYKVRNGKYEDLVKSLVSPGKLQTTSFATAEFILTEPLHISQLLADLPHRWDPAQYLVHNASKQDAANFLLTARKRVMELDEAMGIRRPPIDGVFLIRPSASQTHMLVLSVLYGERISHCLIEQTDQGWGFERSNIYLATIGDFVSYYAHTSLETHNDVIQCRLSMPALAFPQPVGGPPQTPTTPHTPTMPLTPSIAEAPSLPSFCE